MALLQYPPTNLHKNRSKHGELLHPITTALALALALALSLLQGGELGELCRLLNSGPKGTLSQCKKESLFRWKSALPAFCVPRSLFRGLGGVNNV